eukprot:765576-Hanusia_phi.AAC.6
MPKSNIQTSARIVQQRASDGQQEYRMRGWRSSAKSRRIAGSVTAIRSSSTGQWRGGWWAWR